MELFRISIFAQEERKKNIYTCLQCTKYVGLQLLKHAQGVKKGISQFIFALLACLSRKRDI